MYEVLWEIAKFIGGLIFFIYGLPFVINFLCSIISKVNYILTGKETSYESNESKKLLEESYKFMNTRR